MPIVKTPDGKIVQFPDSMPEQEINDVLDKEYNKPVPPPISPWSKWANIQGKGLQKALETGGNIATGIVPPLNLLRPNWWEAYRKAPQSGLPPGALTGGEYTPEEIARVGQEGQTKEAMLGKIAGGTLENLALMTPGGPTDVALGYGAKLAGKGISKAFGMMPESFKTTVGKLFESVKQPYTVEEGTTTGLRKGAETSIKELENVKNQLYQRASQATPMQGKVNFDSTVKGLNDFDQTSIFGRLKPPEKDEIRSVIQQIGEEISPASRTGKSKISSQQLEDIIQTGTGQFIGGTGQIRMPGTFESARGTRSWLSEESYKAFKKGDKNLANAYRELKDVIETDLQNSVGADTWKLWKEADSFNTRKEMMNEIFGRKQELWPGRYNFKAIKKDIQSISPQKLDAAGFSPEEIQALNKIGDAHSTRVLFETFPELKVIAPYVVLEMIGLGVPSLSPLRRAASHTHLLPGVGIGGY